MNVQALAIPTLIDNQNGNDLEVALNNLSGAHHRLALKQGRCAPDLPG